MQERKMGWGRDREWGERKRGRGGGRESRAHQRGAVAASAGGWTWARPSGEARDGRPCGGGEERERMGSDQGGARDIG